MDVAIVQTISIFFFVIYFTYSPSFAQFVPSTGHHGPAYYETFMLCSQTPQQYRGSFCRRDQDCNLPRLTRCLGQICCAKDSVSLKALSMLKTMKMGNSNSAPRQQTTVPRTQTNTRSQDHSRQGNQDNQQIQQKVAKANNVPRMTDTRLNPPQVQQQGQIQQQQRQPQQLQQQKHLQKQPQQQTGVRIQQPAAVMNKLNFNQAASANSQNTVQDKTSDRVIDKVGSKMSRFTGHSRLGSLSSGGHVVKELTAQEAASRRAHMQNANRPNNPSAQRLIQVQSVISSQGSISTTTNQQQPSVFNRFQGGGTQGKEQSRIIMSSPDTLSPNDIPRQEMPTSPSADTPSLTDCDDIAIIGAGLAGTYAAWRMRNTGRKIGLYELSDRVGGRLFTYKFREAPDINVELGPMMYLPEIHKKIARAAQELRLPVINFVEGLNLEDKTLYYLREVHLKYSDLGGINTPFNLRKAELKSPHMLRAYLSDVYTNFSGNRSNFENELYSIITGDGVPLYQQSYSEAFAKMASREASSYLRHHLAFHSHSGRSSAAIQIPYSYNQVNYATKTIASGMDSFPKTFLQEFLSQSQRHSFRHSNKLIKIQNNKGKGYLLDFRKTKSINGKTTVIENSKIQICAENVILALPKVPIIEIECQPTKSQDIASSLNSVFDCPIVKIYFVYDYPWWRNIVLNFTQTKTDLPIRHTYDFGISRNTGKAVMLVTLADGEDVEYWRQLQNHGRKVGWRNDEYAVTEHVVTHVHIHLSYVYNISMNQIPQPRDGSMMIWESGWSSWKPGYRWYEVKNNLIRPSKTDNVFIANGYYDVYPHNIWLEGALEGVDNIMSQFGLPAF